MHSTPDAVTSGRPGSDSSNYHRAMGQLLALYAQVDRLIMEVCAERVCEVHDPDVQLALAKQVGDEARHVGIQREWMREFGADGAPLISADHEQKIRAHFRALGWVDFLADLYVFVEGVGTQTVEELVPLVDPGTRESLRIRLSDEADHVAFGLAQLSKELSRWPAAQRAAFLEGLPARGERLADDLHSVCDDLPGLFEAVGADYDEICDMVLRRRAELLQQIAHTAAGSRAATIARA